MHRRGFPAPPHIRVRPTADLPPCGGGDQPVLTPRARSPASHPSSERDRTSAFEILEQEEARPSTDRRSEMSLPAVLLPAVSAPSDGVRGGSGDGDVSASASAASNGPSALVSPEDYKLVGLLVRGRPTPPSPASWCPLLTRPRQRREDVIHCNDRASLLTPSREGVDVWQAGTLLITNFRLVFLAFNVRGRARPYAPLSPAPLRLIRVAGVTIAAQTLTTQHRDYALRPMRSDARAVPLALPLLHVADVTYPSQGDTGDTRVSIRAKTFRNVQISFDASPQWVCRRRAHTARPPPPSPLRALTRVLAPLCAVSGPQVAGFALLLRGLVFPSRVPQQTFALVHGTSQSVERAPQSSTEGTSDGAAEGAAEGASDCAAEGVGEAAAEGPAADAGGGRTEGTAEGPMAGPAGAAAAEEDEAGTESDSAQPSAAWPTIGTPASGWSIYDTEADLRRVGLVGSGEGRRWRVARNRAFEVCATYPEAVAVPAAMTGAEVNAVAAYRSKVRALSPACPNTRSSWVSLARRAAFPPPCGATPGTERS